MIRHYYHSGHYDTVNQTFSYCIIPYFQEYNKEQFGLLLKEATSNPQCYGRDEKHNTKSF